MSALRKWLTGAAREAVERIDANPREAKATDWIQVARELRNAEVPESVALEWASLCLEAGREVSYSQMALLCGMTQSGYSHLVARGKAPAGNKRGARKMVAADAAIEYLLTRV